MPIVTRQPRTVFDLDDSHTQVEAPVPASPGVGTVIGAAFRQSNTIASMIDSFASGDHGIGFDTTPGYSAWDDVKGTPYADHWNAFAGSTSKKQTDYLKARVDREQTDKATLAASGWGGTIASLAAGIADPTILLPLGGGLTKAGGGVYRLSRGFLQGAAAGGVGTAIQETALQASQETRDTEESITNIGGGVVLGGLLGGAVSFLSKGERETALKAFDDLHDAAQPVSTGSIGAAAVKGLSKEDLTIAGDGAQAVAKATQFISPNMRLNQSPSTVARQAAQDLAEGTMYQAMHAEGRSAGPAVETLARSNFRARMASGVEAHNDIFKEMKQSGINMSRPDFEDAIGRAMRSEDVGENDFISRAAKSWRETVVEPYFSDAKNAELLADSDKAEFAPSYFPRQYNSKVLTANEAQIKEEWSAFMEGRIQKDYAESAEGLRTKLAQHDTVLQDLSLTPKKRAARVTDLEAQGTALDAVNTQHVERISQVNDLRGRAREAANKGDHAEAESLRAEAKRVYAEGGDGLGRYLKERRSLRSRHARLSDSPATAEARRSRTEKVAGRRGEALREFYDRWEIKRGGEGIDINDPAVMPKFRDLAKDVVDEVFDKLTGRNYGDGSSVEPEYMTPIARGPVRERTLPIPDEILQRQGVLNDNVIDVLHRYARVMGADTELTAKFGNPRLSDQLGAIKDEYRKLREAVADKPRELAKLAARETQDTDDLMALRDLLRGTYKAKENGGTYARVVRAAQHVNYVRSMGGVIPASLSDLYRPAMVHGLLPFLREGILPLVKNMSAVKLSVKEARLAGQITETVLQQRMMSLGEIGDPMARGNPVERFLENSSKVASKLNGIQYWTDAMKSVTSVLSQNRVLASKDKRLLAFLGLDEDMAARVQGQFAKHGEVRDGVHIANTEAWDDALAVKNFRAAVSKDVDSIIVTPGVGDVPLFANTPTGKLILQFRSFMFASHQRVLLRGMQEGKAGFAASMVGMTALGMMAATLKAWRGGADRFEKFKAAAENPGYLIGEGLDNSGMFTLPFDMANTTEKLSTSAGFKFNPIKNPMMWGGSLARPGSSQQGESIRFSSRGPLGTFLGPTAGMLEQGFTAAQGAGSLARGEPVSKSARNAAIGLVPFNSYLGMREAVQALNGDSPYTDTER